MFLAKAEKSEDYGGYTDYEEPNPAVLALQNMSRESTRKSIYENMSRESTGKSIYENMYS